jgi:hypothetical protein
MKDFSPFEKQHIQFVSNFQDLTSLPFLGETNAMCWNRSLVGDFSEIVDQIELNDAMKVIELEELRALQLSEQGQLAVEILLNDYKLLADYGASPVLNIIKSYEEDPSNPFFPTDVYSFHVDRSPIPTDTFLCTYLGESSEILPNSNAIQKVLVPEIIAELKVTYQVKDKDFEDFIKEHFFDLHYQAITNFQPIKLGNGHIWKLAIDHPELKVPPCIHRAPKEKGKKRLLLIC